jgi:hypothetical protein
MMRLQISDVRVQIRGAAWLSQRCSFPSEIFPLKSAIS